MFPHSHWSKSTPKKRTKDKVNLYKYPSPLNHQGRFLFTPWFPYTICFLFSFIINSFEYLLSWQSKEVPSITTSVPSFILHVKNQNLQFNPPQTLCASTPSKIFMKYIVIHTIIWAKNGMRRSASCPCSFAGKIKEEKYYEPYPNKHRHTNIFLHVHNNNIKKKKNKKIRV